MARSKHIVTPGVYVCNVLVPPFQRLNHLYHWRMPQTPTDCTALKFYAISNGERLRRVEPILPEVVKGGKPGDLGKI